jgi:hypothetical protein
VNIRKSATTHATVVVYAPIANCGGVCVVDTVVDVHVPNFRSVPPDASCEQFPNATIADEPAVHAAKMIADVFATDPPVPDAAGMSVPATLFLAHPV